MNFSLYMCIIYVSKSGKAGSSFGSKEEKHHTQSILLKESRGKIQDTNGAKKREATLGKNCPKGDAHRAWLEYLPMWGGREGGREGGRGRGGHLGIVLEVIRWPPKKKRGDGVEMRKILGNVGLGLGPLSSW
jgi:hypothetical protein